MVSPRSDPPLAPAPHRSFRALKATRRRRSRARSELAPVRWTPRPSHQDRGAPCSESPTPTSSSARPVRLVTELGHSRKRVARDLGVSAGALRDWIHRYAPAEAAASDALPEAEQSRQLRRELHRLQVERDILGVRSQGVVGRISEEALGRPLPLRADELVRRQTPQRLQPLRVVVRKVEARQVPAQLGMAPVVVPLHRRLLPPHRGGPPRWGGVRFIRSTCPFVHGGAAASAGARSRTGRRSGRRGAARSTGPALGWRTGCRCRSARCGSATAPSS